MNSLADCSVLTFTPTTLRDIRKIYDLEEDGAMKSAVEELEEWVRKQSHFTVKKFNKQFLETTIISCKGSQEKARARLEKYCSLKITMSKLVERINVREECRDVFDIFQVCVLPKYTGDYYRVIFLRMNDKPLKNNTLTDLYVYFISLIEYIKTHDYNNGMVVIVDQRESNLTDLILKLKPLELHQIIKLTMHGLGMRAMGINLVTESKLIKVIVAIMKRLLSAKISGRIQVHRNMETINEVVPKDMLPSDYGGLEKTLSELHEDWLNALTTREHLDYLESMQPTRTMRGRNPPESESQEQQNNTLEHVNFNNLCID